MTQKSPPAYNFCQIVAALVVLTAGISAPCSLLMAQEAPGVIPLSGWTQPNGDPGLVLSHQSNAVTYSSPVIAEIDGDPANGKEVAVSSSDGRLHVYRADGSLLWTRPLPNFGCGNPTQRAASSPAVGELLGNGVPFVVVGYGNLRANEQHCGGGVVAFRGPDGRRHFNLNLRRYDQQRSRRERGVARERLFNVLSTPALADTNGNGKLEIGFGSWDRHVYLLNARGRVIWHYQAADTVWSSPAFADLDGDGDLEMIIGTDISANKSLRPPTKNGGYVYALKTRLSAKLRNKYRSNRNVLVRFRDSDLWLWQTWFDQTIFSSPAVGDVLPDNPGQEVVIASGYYFPEGSKNKNGKWVKILDGLTGQVLSTLNTGACSASSPALADLDFDGVPEIVHLANAHKSFGGDGPTRLAAWKAATGEQLWEVELPIEGANYYFNSPIVADLNGDGTPEVVVAHKQRILIFNGADGAEYSCRGNDCGAAALDLRGGVSFRNSPAIADLSGNGQMALVAAGGLSSRQGAIFAWTNFAAAHSAATHSAATHSAAAADCDQCRYWPMARGDSQRQGLHPQ